MALRSLSRAGVEVGGRVAGKRATHAARHVVLGAERKMSSFVGEGHGQGQFGRSQAPSYRQGTLSSGTQLFKLVETDLMSKELTRYGPSDAEHLGLHSIEDVLADIAAATPPQEPAAPIATAIVPSVVTVSSDAQEDPVAAVAAATAAPAAREAEVLAAWGLEPVVTDAPEVEVDGVEAPTAGKVDKVEEEGVSQEKMAIKRTYQPSTLKRKRKHGFLYRVKTRLGKKILQRRQDKGRWRLGI